MKQGRTLPELVTEVERQRSAKKDALVYSNSLVMASNGTSRLALPEDAGAFQLQPTAHRQLGQHLSIPSAFYDAMQAHVEDWLDPEGRPLFDTTVNSLLRARPADEKRLVRTLDGNARAFLSAKYRAMDNLPILASVLPVLQEEQGIDWQGASMEVTDSRLYLKLVNQRVQGEVKVGDIVQAGVLITNSEVGLGAFRVQPLMFRLVCSNGLVTPDQSAGRMARHVGGVLGGNGSDEAFEWLADDTLAARSDATIKEMRDALRGLLLEGARHRSRRGCYPYQWRPLEGGRVGAGQVRPHRRGARRGHAEPDRGRRPLALGLGELDHRYGPDRRQLRPLDGARSRRRQAFSTPCPRLESLG